MGKTTRNKELIGAGEGLRLLAGKAGSRARISEEAEDAASGAGFTGEEICKHWRRGLNAAADAKGGDDLAADMTRSERPLGIKPRERGVDGVDCGTLRSAQSKRCNTSTNDVERHSRSRSSARASQRSGVRSLAGARR